MRASCVLLYGLLSLVVWGGAARAMDGINQNGGADAPEPSTVVLMGIGLAAGGFVAWRSRRTKRQRGTGDADSSAPGGSAD